VAISACFVSVGVTSVWAMLRTRQLLLGSCAVLAVGMLAACIPSFYMGILPFRFWGTLLIFEAVFLLASLFVVRVSGYRLVRISARK